MTKITLHKYLYDLFCKKKIKFNHECIQHTHHMFSSRDWQFNSFGIFCEQITGNEGDGIKIYFTKLQTSKKKKTLKEACLSWPFLLVPWFSRIQQQRWQVQWMPLCVDWFESRESSEIGYHGNVGISHRWSFLGSRETFQSEKIVKIYVTSMNYTYIIYDLKAVSFSYVPYNYCNILLKEILSKILNYLLQFSQITHK